MQIGQVIRRHRRARGMTLEAVAAQSGTDAASLSRIERGLQGYTPEGLSAIAGALGTTAASLMVEAESIETAGVKPVADEQELLSDYRRLRGSARSLIKLMVAEMAKSTYANNDAHS